MLHLYFYSVDTQKLIFWDLLCFILKHCYNPSFALKWDQARAWACSFSALTMVMVLHLWACRVQQDTVNSVAHGYPPHPTHTSFCLLTLRVLRTRHTPTAPHWCSGSGLHISDVPPGHSSEDPTLCPKQQLGRGQQRAWLVPEIVLVTDSSQLLLR